MGLVFCELRGDHMEVFLHCAEGETASLASTFTMSLLFKVSSRGLAMGWVGWGWQPPCGNKQESGDALIAALICHCRTPCVPVSEANSHPALLPQQHRNHHVGVLKTDFLALLKPREPAAGREPRTALLPPHGLTTLKSQRHSLRPFFLSLKTSTRTHTPDTHPSPCEKSTKLIST